MNQSLVSIFAATAAYLFLKVFANSGVQAYGRFRYKSYKYKEDEPFFGQRFENQPPQPELLMRAEAAWRNDLENIPWFLFGAVAAVMAGIDPSVFRFLCVTFCGARTIHTITLLSSRQPWRFLAYMTGVITTMLLYFFTLRTLGWGA